jgi:chaperonin GroES
MNSTAVAVEENIGNKAERKLRPLYDRILVRVKVVEDVAVNGVYRPQVAVEKPQEGLVLGVGPGRIVNGERIPIDIQVGDVVVFSKYSGNEVQINNEPLLLLKEDEVQAVFYTE